MRRPRFVKFHPQTLDGLDGIDFNTDSSRMVLALKRDDRVHSELIHVGRLGWHSENARIFIAN
jgi:hypothetical protein